MKKIAALVGTLAMATSVQAEVLTYAFKAEIDNVLLYVGDSITQPASSTVRGRTVAEGDIVTGLFSIDTTTGLYSQQIWNGGILESYTDWTGQKQNTVVAAIGANGPAMDGARPDASNHITVLHATDAWQYDRLTVLTSLYADQDHAESASINFMRRPNGVSSGILTSLIGMDNNPHFIYSFADYTASSYTAMSASGNLTSLTRVTSAVPEPGTYAMLLSGLALVAWRRRSRG